MTHELMPYFYGHPDSWRKLYQLENADTEFLDFLQAGMARVLVPVTPGFENRIINFLNSGIIFEGDDAESLVLDTPISLALNAELRNVAQKYPIQEGKSWEVRVPTSLTILQCGSGCVKENGLPCKCNEGKTIAMG
jgi:hypothetical protein